MKELLQTPTGKETEILFAPVVSRDLKNGDKKQSALWQKYFSILTEKPLGEIAVISPQQLLTEAVKHSIMAPDIEKVLQLFRKKHEERSLEGPEETEKQIIISAASFHIRYSESEYRLSVEPDLAVREFEEVIHRATNLDVYGPSTLSRVRFSPEFNQVRLNVKIPISETPGGKRTRLKLEYVATRPTIMISQDV